MILRKSQKAPGLCTMCSSCDLWIIAVYVYGC